MAAVLHISGKSRNDSVRVGIDNEVPVGSATRTLSRRFIQKRRGAGGSLSNISFECADGFTSTHLLKKITQPLRPGNRGGFCRCDQLPRIDPFRKFGQDGRYLIKPTGMMVISNQINRRCLRSGNMDYAAWRVEMLHRYLA